MKHIAGTRALYQTLTGVYEDVTLVMQTAVDQIAAILPRYAVNDVIPEPLTERVVDRVGDAVGRQFTDGRRAFGDDGVTPLALFPALLNRRYVAVTRSVIRAHASMMARLLPDDLQTWLMTARDVAQEQAFLTNPLAGYDPMHTWVDPNGYRLSDRIWRSGQTTRMKLDRLVADGIRQGRSAMAIARDSQAYMLPGRALRRTRWPYDRDASYHGMVLARTEIARAHGAAVLAASAANPFVNGIDWKLSMRHPEYDVCDKLATLDREGKRVRDPYTVDVHMWYPPHPQCLCALMGVVAEDTDAVIDDLRDRMRRGDPAPLTPLPWRRLLQMLIGNRLADQNQEFEVQA